MMLRHYEKRHEATTKERRPAVRYPVIGNYVLMEEIGRGSFGQVQLALQLDTLQPVAVKIISKDKAREYSSSTAVRKEIKIMQELQHPNVVKLIDVLSTQSRVLVMMDYVEGGELYDEVNQFGKLSEPYARFFFQQLIQGLDYCHTNGVYHRDLKLDNLLLDRNKTLKITDFGMSTYRVRSAKMLHTPVGTPMFAAPELIGVSAEGYSGAKSDVWSCGIILYMMCSGKVPFESENLHYLFHQIKRCYVEYPAYFSEQLKDLLSNIFQPNVNNRYSLRKVSRHPWFSGPITTSEVGDDRKSAPSKLSSLSQKIQAVILEYDSYKQEAALHKRTSQSLVPIEVHPPRVDHPRPRTQPASSASHANRNPAFDSLAIGWVKNADIGLSASPLPVGSSMHRLNSTANDLSEPPIPESDTDDFLTPDAVPGSTTSSLTPPDQMNQSNEIVPDLNADASSVSDQWSRTVSSNRRFSFRSFGSRNSRFDSEMELELEFGSFPSKNSNLRPVRSRSGFALGRVTTYSSDDRSQIISNGDPMKLERLRQSLWHSFAVGRNSATEESTDAGSAFRSSNSTSVLVRSKSLNGRRLKLVPTKKRLRSKNHSDEERCAEFLLRQKQEPHSNRAPEGMAGRNRRRVRSPSPSILSDKSPMQYATSDNSTERMDHIIKMWERKSHGRWSRFMGEINMIPDEQEFSIASDKLESLWASKLEEEGYRQPTRTKKTNKSNRNFSTRQNASDASVSMSILETSCMRTDGPNPDEIFVAQSLRAIEPMESHVIDGDIFTNKRVPEDWLKKYVNKTGFDYDEASAIELAKHDESRHGTGSRAVEYFTYVVSIARGELHSTIAESLEKQTQSLLDIQLEVPALTTTPTAMESLLARTTGNDSSGENAKEKLRPHKGLKTVAIGPLHEDYKRRGNGMSSDENLDDTSSDVERTEMAKKLKIFDYPIPGPSPEDALIRPTLLPFEQYLKGPRQYIKRMIPTPSLVFPPRAQVKYTIPHKFEKAFVILRECFETEGGDVHELQKSNTQAKLQVNIVVDDCRLRLLAWIVGSGPSLRHSAVSLRRTSGTKDKYAKFAISLDKKLSTASANKYSGSQSSSS